MLPVGHLSVARRSVGSDRLTRLTRDEQLAHLSLWCLLPSPLMVGANLPDNDEWTLALLTNPEVLAVDQDRLGRPAEKIVGPNLGAEVWVRELSGGAHAVGLFNRTAQPVQVSFPWRELSSSARPQVRDLWLRKDLGKQKNFTAEIPPHGGVLLRVK